MIPSTYNNLFQNLNKINDLIPVMKRLEQLYCEEINQSITYKFDAMVNHNIETYKIHINKWRSIRVESEYIGDNGYPFCRSILSMDLNSPTNSNYIGYGYITYSMLNSTMKFVGAEKYEIQKPYIHDPAKYFQYLTLYELPPEEWFALSTEIMNTLDTMDIYFPYLILYFSNSISYDIENLTNFLNLLQKGENND